MRHRLQNIFYLGVKELRSLRRDTMMLVLIVLAFSGQVYLTATGVPESLHKAPIAIVDEDRSPLSERIVNAFYPPHFLAPAVIEPYASDAGMDAGLYTFVLDIPPNFQRDVLAGRQPTIQLNVDATRMSQAFIGNSYIQTIVNGEVVVIVAMASMVFIVQGLLEVPIQGSMALFIVGMMLHLFATTSMGIFLGTVARSMPQMGLLMLIILLPLQMLSGGLTPRESMPALAQNLMLAAPTTHFVALAQAILYRGAGLGVVWPQFLALLAIGSVFFALALARFRKTISSMA